MKKILSHKYRTAGCSLLIFFAFAAFSAEPVAKEGGVCFRFDDNHPVAQWREMAQVFEKHNCRFSLSVVPGRWLPPDYGKFLQEMEAKGYELMDHSPNHGMFKFETQNVQERKEAEKLAPYIDHWSGGRVCFKFVRNPKQKGVPLVCDLSGKKATLISCDAPKGKKIRFARGYLYDPQTQQAWHGSFDKGVFTLRNFWYEDDVDLPARSGVSLEYHTGAGAFEVPEAVLEFLIATSRRDFQALGVQNPVTFIQPGNQEALPSAAGIARTYCKSGYIGGATGISGSQWGYCENGAKESRAFAMQWGEINLEQQTRFIQTRHKIAEAYALHRVACASSHLDASKVPGGWKEFLKRHDELLQWCREKGIPVRTQKEWCQRLYYSTTVRGENIMPSLKNDFDGDGVPDGYKITAAGKAENGKLLIHAAGTAAEIYRLCGAEPGKNTLSFRYSTEKAGKLRFDVYAMNASGAILQSYQLPVEVKSGSGQNAETTFDLRNDSDMLCIKIRALSVAAPVTIEEISLKGN